MLVAEITAPTKVRFSSKVGAYLFKLIPRDVARAIRLRIPFDAELQDERQGLLIACGPPTPLRCLFLYLEQSGMVSVELHQFTPRGSKVLALALTEGDRIGEVLTKWGQDWGL